MSPDFSPDHRLKPSLVDLRQRVARLERVGPDRAWGRLGLGIASIDQALPGGGLSLGALHEICGAGPDSEHATAAAMLAGGLLAQTRGSVIWAVQRRDIFAPGLAGVGLHPDRVVYAEAGKPEKVLLVMEEALRHRGLGGVVGELSGRLGLTASRRLQLSAETSGVVAFALRRSQRHDDPVLNEPSAAITRWRVSVLPAQEARDLPPGLDRPRWRLELLRCRGAEQGSWIVEGCDATGRLAVAADMADRSSMSSRGQPIQRAIA